MAGPGAAWGGKLSGMDRGKKRSRAARRSPRSSLSPSRPVRECSGGSPLPLPPCPGMTHERRSLSPSPSSTGPGGWVGRMDLIKLPALGIWERSQLSSDGYLERICIQSCAFLLPPPLFFFSGSHTGHSLSPHPPGHFFRDSVWKLCELRLVLLCSLDDVTLGVSLLEGTGAERRCGPI